MLVAIKTKPALPGVQTIADTGNVIMVLSESLFIGLDAF